VSTQIELWGKHYPELLNEHKEVLTSCNTVPQRLAAFWAISQRYALTHPLNDKAWITVTYEELVIEGEAVLEKIFSRWNMPIPKAALQQLRRPSKTSVAGSAPNDPRAQLSLWKDRLTTQEQDDIFRTIRSIGVDLYDTGIMPTASYKD